MYRLIALDVDCTLLDPDGKVTPATRQAIQMARAEGVYVVLATGRSWQEAEHLVPLSGCDSRMVCQGGTAVADCAQKRNLQQWTLPREQAVAAMEALEAHGFGLLVFADNGLWVDQTGDDLFVSYESPGFHRYKQVRPTLAGFFAHNTMPVNKIYAQAVHTGQFDAVRPHLEEMDGLFLTSSGWNNLEIVPTGVDKGTGLRALARLLDVPMEQTAGIGDNDNDLGMFDAVAMPIAMGNAPRHVKERAGRVTAPNDRDGVAQAIRALLAENKNASV